MSLRQYLFLMTVGTGLCWLAWVFVLFNIDPFKIGWLGFLFFYSTLFFALVGTISVMGFLIRWRILGNDDIVFRHVKKTFRQGIFMALAVVIILFLLQKDLLTWWNGTIVIIIFLLIEGIIFTNRRYSNQDYVRKDL